MSHELANAVANAVFAACQRQVSKSRSLDNLNLDSIVSSAIKSSPSKAQQKSAGRTDQQIVDQTNELARTLYQLRGYEVRAGYRFDQATHPHEVEAWQGACAAQLLLRDTDPQDALDNL